MINTTLMTAMIIVIALGIGLAVAIYKYYELKEQIADAVNFKDELQSYKDEVAHLNTMYDIKSEDASNLREHNKELAEKLERKNEVINNLHEAIDNLQTAIKKKDVQHIAHIHSFGQSHIIIEDAIHRIANNKALSNGTARRLTRIAREAINKATAQRNEG